MENASKALIIAGAILISILLISVGILIFNSTSGVTDSAGDTDFAMMIASAKESAKIILETMDEDIKNDESKFREYILARYDMIIMNSGDKSDGITVAQVVELSTLVTERSFQLVETGAADKTAHISRASGKVGIKVWFDRTKNEVNFDRLEKNKKYKAILDPGGGSITIYEK